MTPDYAELLRALSPEIALVIGALSILGIDLAFGRGWSHDRRLAWAVNLAVLALGAAIYVSFSAGTGGAVFDGVFALDALALATRIGVLLLTALTLVLLPEVSRLPHPAEYVAVTLFSAAGFSLMAVAQQLLLAFLALELASLSLYVLAGFDKTRAESAEAALKYFLFGGIATAFLLFGFSLLFGLTGSIALPQIAAQLRTLPPTPLLLVAMTMILVGFGYKAAAAPFHPWAPDVYQGAPATSAALVASASKLAGFALFTRLLWGAGAPVAGSVATPQGASGWLLPLAVISAASLLLGNLGALAQSNVRRLLAYSAIAHAGSLLLGVMSAGAVGPGPLYYYAATYGLATVGAFGVLAVMERTGAAQSLADLAGLHRRSPLLAGCLLVYVLSLAGIPPLAGFFGKFLVFAAALHLGGLASIAGGLTVLAILLSAVGLYYYLLILKQVFVVPAAPASRIPVPLPAALALGTIALLSVLLGVMPSLILRLF